MFSFNVVVPQEFFEFQYRILSLIRMSCQNKRLSNKIVPGEFAIDLQLPISDLRFSNSVFYRSLIEICQS